MRHLIVWLVACLAFALPAIGLAKGGSSKGSSSGGRVSVRSYTKKDGTHVEAHTRSAPGSGGRGYSYSGGDDGIMPDVSTPPRTEARTAARTEARNFASHSEAEEKLKALADRKALDMRTWKAGEFTVKAEFAGIMAGKVRLKKIDGSTISVDLAKLSEADQEWVQKRTTESRR